MSHALKKYNEQKQNPIVRLASSGKRYSPGKTVSPSLARVCSFFCSMDALDLGHEESRAAGDSSWRRGSATEGDSNEELAETDQIAMPSEEDVAMTFSIGENRSRVTEWNDVQQNKIGYHNTRDNTPSRIFAFSIPKTLLSYYNFHYERRCFEEGSSNADVALSWP